MLLITRKLNQTQSMPQEEPEILRPKGGVQFKFEFPKNTSEDGIGRTSDGQG
jgi:hypothetical protein